MTFENFWQPVSGAALAQGDWIPKCIIPQHSPAPIATRHSAEVELPTLDLLVVTQSCDLVNNKIRLVAMIPIFSLADFESINPSFAKKGRWNDVLKDRVETNYLLGSPTQPDDNRQALVVDFREIDSLPINYLTDHAASLGPRWRLKSPFLEHFSQAFARFFMRVGLPSSIPEFR